MKTVILSAEPVFAASGILRAPMFSRLFNIKHFNNLQDAFDELWEEHIDGVFCYLVFSHGSLKDTIGKYLVPMYEERLTKLARDLKKHFINNPLHVLADESHMEVIETAVRETRDVLEDSLPELTKHHKDFLEEVSDKVFPVVREEHLNIHRVEFDQLLREIIVVLGEGVYPGANSYTFTYQTS